MFSRKKIVCFFSLQKNRLKISIISLQEIAYFVTHCRAWMRLQRLRNYLSFCCKCKFFGNHFTLHVISNAHRRRIVIVYTFLWWNLKSKKKTQEDFGLHFALISKWAPKIVWNFVKKTIEIAIVCANRMDSGVSWALAGVSSNRMKHFSL